MDDNEIQIQNQLQASRAAEREPGEQDLPKTEKPMGLFLFLFLLIISVIGDAIELFTVGTIGWLSGLLVDAILLLTLGLSKAGRRQLKRIFVAVGLETIPVVGVLPIRTVFLIWAFAKSRSKTIQKVSTKIERVAPHLPNHKTA